MDTPPILNVVGERIALGPLSRDLLPLYHRWDNNFATASDGGVPIAPITVEGTQGWFERMSQDNARALFTVYLREGMRPIGLAGIRDIEYPNRSAEFSITIGESSERGKGYGTEATRLVLDYAFTALGLHNVLLTVAAFNQAAIRAYEKAGFREIGRRREAWYMGGRMWDEVLMDCLSSEFSSPVLAGVFVPDEPR